MQANRRRDTSPERLLRSELHRAGLRYRLDRPVVPGLRRRGDIVFVRARVAVFVDGCFWHVCPKHASWPKSNAEWWKQKLEANVARDRDTDRRLRRAGWSVIRIWEHEDPRVAARRVLRIVTSRKR